MTIEKGKKFFWGDAIFPYVITDVLPEHVYYKRNGCQEKRVYKYVFEDAIKQGRISEIA